MTDIRSAVSWAW